MDSGVLILLPVALLVVGLIALGLLFLWRRGLFLSAAGIGSILFVIVMVGWMVWSRSPRPPAAGDDVSDYQGSAAPVEKLTLPWSAAVEGTWKNSSDEASTDALKNAHKQVVAFLHGRNPDLSWIPQQEYVREHLLKNLSNSNAGFKEQRGTARWIQIADHSALEQESDFEGLGKMRQVRLQVTITENDMQEMLHLDRQVRAGHRQYALLKILAGLVAVMTTVAIYSRLQDTTKGHYTWMLRLAAVGFVGSVGAMLLTIS